MRIAFVFSLLCAALAAAPMARSQETTSLLELYGGYDYVRFNINSNVSGQPPFQTFNGNGGGGQLIFNLNNWFGVLGDVSGIWAANSTTGGAAIPYVFGPRISLRRRLIVPFAQVLFGGVTTSGGIAQTGWQTHFAMTTGGGIDVPISEHFSIRPLQAEYFLTKIPDGLSNRQDNFRFSAGVSFHFGRS
jgi:hypothetical protein